MKLVNIRVDSDKWNLFKKLAKLKNSDASKLIRTFIDDFIKKYHKS